MPSLHIKVLVTGSSMVGKTAIVSSFCSDGADFPKAYNLTTGVDISTKSLLLPDGQGTVEFLLVDCSGRDVYDEAMMAQADQPCAVIVVYDITNRQSFESANRCANKLRTKLGNRLAHIPAILVGNKSDLPERREVSTSEGEEKAKSMECTFTECSARDWESVTAPFRAMSTQLLDMYKSRTARVNNMLANRHAPRPGK